MKLIIDVSYQSSQAKVVGGFFENWDDDVLVEKTSKIVENVQEPEASLLIEKMFGKFRLPNLIKQVDTETKITWIMQ